MVAVDPQLGHFGGAAVMTDDGRGSFNSGSVDVLW
jgi:hypothetical protein